MLWICLGSWVFYGLWRIDFLLLLIGVSAGNYLASRFLDPSSKVRNKSFLLAVTVICNLMVLAYFKYANFAMENASAVLQSFGFASISWVRIILPVGISFYVFQAMSYSIDVYRGDAPRAKNFLFLSAYISLFPQLIAGPIVRYKDVAHQLIEPHISIGRTARGAKRFMLGFAKKVLLADGLSSLADASFALAHPAFGDAWLGALAFSLQLYLDFAAYSDMAIGLGLMMGLRFRENFLQPYASRGIGEFWRRWHISLSSWLRDYLYIPLGGNRKGSGRTKLNLVVVMLLGGLWHGANWTFIAWGLWHGLWLVVDRYAPRKLPGFAGRLATLTIILVGWVVFRADSIGYAFRFLGAMAGSGGWGLSSAFAWSLRLDALAPFVLSLVFVAVEIMLTDRSAAKDSGNVRSTKQLTMVMIGPRLEAVLYWVLSLGLFILAIAKMLAGSYSPFLYFQF